MRYMPSKRGGGHRLCMVSILALYNNVGVGARGFGLGAGAMGLYFITGTNLGTTLGTMGTRLRVLWVLGYEYYGY